MIGMTAVTNNTTPRANASAASTTAPQSSPSSFSSLQPSSSVSSLISSAASIRFIPSSTAAANGMSYRSGGSLSAPAGPTSTAPASANSNNAPLATFAASSPQPQQHSRLHSSTSDAVRDRSTPLAPSSRAVASYVAPSVAVTAANPSPPLTRSSSPHQPNRSGTSPPTSQIEGGSNTTNKSVITASQHSSPRGIGDKVVLTVDPCPPLGTQPASPDSTNDSSNEMANLIRPALSIHTSSAAEQHRSPSAEARRIATPSPVNVTQPLIGTTDSSSIASANGLPHH
jgi:hypothetical protein